MLTSLDRYAIEHARRQIEGYYIPRTTDSSRSAFERARAECAAAFRRRADEIMALTFEQYFPKVARTAPEAQGAANA